MKSLGLWRRQVIWKHVGSLWKASDWFAFILALLKVQPDIRGYWEQTKLFNAMRCSLLLEWVLPLFVSFSLSSREEQAPAVLQIDFDMIVLLAPDFTPTCVWRIIATAKNNYSSYKASMMGGLFISRTQMTLAELNLLWYFKNNERLRTGHLRVFGM